MYGKARRTRVASSPGHTQILSHSGCEIKSGCGPRTRLGLEDNRLVKIIAEKLKDAGNVRWLGE